MHRQARMSSWFPLGYAMRYPLNIFFFIAMRTMFCRRNFPLCCVIVRYSLYIFFITVWSAVIEIFIPTKDKSLYKLLCVKNRRKKEEHSFVTFYTEIWFDSFLNTFYVNLFMLSLTSSWSRGTSGWFLLLYSSIGLLTNLTRQARSKFNSSDHTSKCCVYLPLIFL